ncbi:hypothetical protein BpHYR1_020303 [Brachionus plicatilis]|uniref:Uncharacterized protein n=1 Tax=Brachionus plicatilis TaxID=10195 RepID=A0A3M7RCM8_BRAPC|nr:hypothetical protein BpHYR1_020303 [Brachionus plicatilis]
MKSKFANSSKASFDFGLVKVSRDEFNSFTSFINFMLILFNSVKFPSNPSKPSHFWKTTI